jgi:hypothetical protein
MQRRKGKCRRGLCITFFFFASGGLLKLLLLIIPLLVDPSPGLSADISTFLLETDAEATANSRAKCHEKGNSFAGLERWKVDPDSYYDKRLSASAFAAALCATKPLLA